MPELVQRNCERKERLLVSDAADDDDSNLQTEKGERACVVTNVPRQTQRQGTPQTSSAPTRRQRAVCKESACEGRDRPLYLEARRISQCLLGLRRRQYNCRCCNPLVIAPQLLVLPENPPHKGDNHTQKKNPSLQQPCACEPHFKNVRWRFVPKDGIGREKTQ